MSEEHPLNLYTTHRHVFGIQALVGAKVLNVGEVDRTGYIRPLRDTLGIARTEGGEGKRERETVV